MIDKTHTLVQNSRDLNETRNRKKVFNCQSRF